MHHILCTRIMRLYTHAGHLYVEETSCILIPFLRQTPECVQCYYGYANATPPPSVT